MEFYSIFIALVILLANEDNIVLSVNLTNGANFTISYDNSSGEISNMTNFHTTTDVEYNFMYELEYDDKSFYLHLGPNPAALMTENRTLEYLATFLEGLERELVYQQLRNCPYTKLCSFDFGIDQPNFMSTEPCCMQCSCDFPDCLFSKTCCIDILLKETRILTDDDFKDIGPNCLSMNLVQGEIIQFANSPEDGVFMIDSCPVGTDEQLDANCTRIYTSEIQYYRDIVPVGHILSPAVYRNRYCAFCNGVKEEKTYLRQSEVILTCGDSSNNFKTEHEAIKAAIDDRTCIIRFQSPEDMNFESCFTVVSQCNVTGQWMTYDAEIEKSCLLYSSIINVNKTMYNNVFCALCNGITNLEHTCEVPHHTDSREVDFSFSGLLKLEADDDKPQNNVNSHDCTVDQLFDSVSGMCRDIVCSPLMLLKRGLCEPMFTEVRAMYYMTYLRIKPIESTTLFQGYQLADRLINYLFSMPVLKDACQVQMVYEVNKEPNNYSDTDLKHAKLSYFKVRIMTLDKYDHDPYQLYEEYSLIHNSNHSLKYFDYSNKTLNYFKVEIELFDHNPRVFDFIEHLQMVEDVDNLTTISVEDSLDELIEKYSIIRNNVSVEVLHMTKHRTCFFAPDSDKALNLLRLNPCPQVFIPKDQEPWQSIEDGILFMKTNQTLSNSQFFFNGSDTVAVCIEFYKQYMLKMNPISDQSLSAMTIVSVICTIVSIVSLFITFIVFLLLPKLRRTIPGKNNMSLVSVLIIAQCFYIVSGIGIFNRGTPQCIAFGMLLHFVWLLSLFWMNICTYHMFHVLTRTKAMSGKTGNVRFGIYHLYAIIMSAMMVGINITVSVTTSGLYGYGENSCYIDTQEMVNYTFAIPVAVVILSNLGMYMFTIYKIKMTSSVQKNVKNERNDFVIFIKLSTITGATWVFGFIYSVTDIIAFSYLFILLNASQGIFIMFAFIINHRVINMFRATILGHDVTFTDTESKSTRSTIHSKQ